MIQKGVEVVFEVSTYGSSKEALIRTLSAILESQLDTYNCCAECFTFEPPFEQNSSGTFYQGVVTASICNTAPKVPGIPWNEYVQAQPPLASITIQTGNLEV